MSGCLISNPKTKSCETTSKIGGLQGRLWLFNLRSADGTKVSYTSANNEISAITLPSGEALYPVDGEKYQHNFTYALTAPGANKFYTQTGNIKTVVDTGADIEWLDEVAKATELGVIYEDMNQRFILLGQFNGMKAVEGDLFDSGAEAASDVGTTISLQGEEKDAEYKLVFDTDYQTTLAYLQSLETPTP